MQPHRSWDSGEPTNRIFGIPYSIYDKFIDALLLYVEYGGWRTIGVDIIEWFSKADVYEKECTRHQLAEYTLRIKLLVIGRAIEDVKQELPAAQALHDCINECLRHMSCKVR